MLLPSEGQNLSASQISSTYLNSRLRYNYFRFGKTNVRHIGILLPVSYNRRVILHQVDEFRPNQTTYGHGGNVIVTSYRFCNILLPVSYLLMSVP